MRTLLDWLARWQRTAARSVLQDRRGFAAFHIPKTLYVISGMSTETSAAARQSARAVRVGLSGLGRPGQQAPVSRPRSAGLAQIDGAAIGALAVKQRGGAFGQRHRRDPADDDVMGFPQQRRPQPALKGRCARRSLLAQPPGPPDGAVKARPPQNGGWGWDRRRSKRAPRSASPPRPAKRSDIACWPSCRRLAQKARLVRIALAAGDRWWMQARSEGCSPSAETEVSEEMVTPWRPASPSVVATATKVAARLMPSRKAARRSVMSLPQIEETFELHIGNLLAEFVILAGARGGEGLDKARPQPVASATLLTNSRRRSPPPDIARNEWSTREHQFL